MSSSKIILVAAAAMFALTTFDAGGQAQAGIKTGDGAYCHWYRQKAMSTGSEYWWDRWRRCVRGDYWD
jgi:hypothetical protein